MVFECFPLFHIVLPFRIFPVWYRSRIHIFIHIAQGPRFIDQFTHRHRIHTVMQPHLTNQKINRICHIRSILNQLECQIHQLISKTVKGSLRIRTTFPRYIE